MSQQVDAEQRIVDQLAGALAVSPGLSAKELIEAVSRTGLTASKTEINAALYRAKATFWNDGGSPPRWQLLTVHPAPSTPAEKPAATLAPAATAAHDRPSRLPALYAWQAESLDAWHSSYHRGVVEAVTGTGKTMVGIAAVADAMSHSARALVLVPSIELLRQWNAQLRKVLPTARVGLLGGGNQTTWRGTDIIVAVVNSARSANLSDPGRGAVLVADECHRYGSEANAQALDERFERRLGLSATYARSDDGNNRYLDPYFGGTCFRMDYRQAIADEVTAHFKVALIAVPFAPGERIAYDEANKAAYDAQQWLLNSGMVAEEPFGEFMKDVAKLAEGEHGRATWKARAFLQNFAERRRILAESPAKRAHLARLAPALKNADRSIVFTQTIDAAEDAVATLVPYGLGAEAIHSQMRPDDRRRTLTRFANGQLAVITAPQVLDEGVDVPAADLAVIVAASRTQRQMIQRMGRVLRRKDDGRLARFAVLFIEGSSEDPARGAHGDFLDEVTDTADAVTTFPTSATAEEIAAYLNDFAPAHAQPAPRMAGESRRASHAPAVSEATAPTRHEEPEVQAAPSPPPPTSSNGELGPRTMTSKRLKRLYAAAGLAKDSRRSALGPVLYRLGDLDDSRLLEVLRTTKDPAEVERMARDPSARLRVSSRHDQAVHELLDQYRAKHGDRWLARFEEEVEKLIRTHLETNHSSVAALEVAIRRSYDPREIDHIARVTAPRLREADRQAAERRSQQQAKPSSPPPSSPTPGRRSTARRALSWRPSSPVRRRYCPSCGLLEEGCRC